MWSGIISAGTPGDQATVQHAALCSGRLLSVIEHWRSHGTAPGSAAASEDGLLYSRLAASATTWMDAKLGDWVVTPRAGAAVEVNALWYNALRIVSALMEMPGIGFAARSAGGARRQVLRDIQSPILEQRCRVLLRRGR